MLFSNDASLASIQHHLTLFCPKTNLKFFWQLVEYLNRRQVRMFFLKMMFVSLQ